MLFCSTYALVEFMKSNHSIQFFIVLVRKRAVSLSGSGGRKELEGKAHPSSINGPKRLFCKSYLHPF